MAGDGWENHSYRKRANVGFGGFLYKESRRSENSFLSISTTRVLAEDSFVFEGFQHFNSNHIQMTLQEIQTRKEDQTFDCKSIQIDPKTLAVPIVAMANADGGVLAIGV